MSKHSPEYYRQRHLDWTSSGVCVRCGKRPPREGVRICQYCTDVAKARNPRASFRRKQIVEARRVLGLCTVCGKRSIDTAVSTCKCDLCLTKIRDHARSTNYASTKKWFSANRVLQKKYWLIGKIRLRHEVFSHYGGSVCACCGETAEQFLSLDHINGGGTKHRRDLKWQGMGFNFYRWLKQQGFPPGYRVLCHNCNKAVSHGKVCPHEVMNELALRCISAC